MATLAHDDAAGFSFWQKMALAMALFIVFGFAQFAARGFVDVPRVPVWVHLHGIVMLAWLGLSIAQPTLVRTGNIARHRQLGWLGVVLAAAVVLLGGFAGVMAVVAGRQPPFFTPPFFLALTLIGVAAFAAMVIAAIVRRRQTDWHQRLMLGATVLILEPALGRVLPMPLIMPWGEIAVMAVQLGVLWLVVRHDGRTLGRVHPATVSVIAVTALSHLAIEALGRAPFMAQWAQSLAAG